MNNYFDVFKYFNDNISLSILIIMFFAMFLIIFILQITKNKYTLYVSITMGIIFGLYFLGATTAANKPVLGDAATNELIINSLSTWFSMVWNIFMFLLLVVLPLYVFSMVSTTFTNPRHHNHGKKLLIVSFLSLWGMTLLGILVAVALFPIILLLKDALQLIPTPTDDSTKTILEVFMNYYSYIVLSSIALAFVFAIVMNLLHSHLHNHGESVISVIEKLRDVIRSYLNIVIYLVPYVISSMILLLFNNYNEAFVTTAQTLSLFITIFFIGLFIITGLEFGSIHLLRRNKNQLSQKDLNIKSIDYSIKDFSVQSAPVLYPITVDYVKSLGVSSEVVETVPTLSTFMGYSMCGGFYPALIVLFTLIQNEPTINGETINMMLTISIMIPLILIMTLGMTGVPGADVAIVLGLLSTLGLNPGYFFTIYLVEPLLDKFRGIGNSYGFSAAAVITDRICFKDNVNNYEDNNIINIESKEVNNEH